MRVFVCRRTNTNLKHLSTGLPPTKTIVGDLAERRLLESTSSQVRANEQEIRSGHPAARFRKARDATRGISSFNKNGRVANILQPTYSLKTSGTRSTEEKTILKGTTRRQSWYQKIRTWHAVTTQTRGLFGLMAQFWSGRRDQHAEDRLDTRTSPSPWLRHQNTGDIDLESGNSQMQGSAGLYHCLNSPATSQHYCEKSQSRLQNDTIEDFDTKLTSCTIRQRVNPARPKQTRPLRSEAYSEPMLNFPTYGIDLVNERARQPRLDLFDTPRPRRTQAHTIYALHDLTSTLFLLPGSSALTTDVLTTIPMFDRKDSRPSEYQSSEGLFSVFGKRARHRDRKPSVKGDEDEEHIKWSTAKVGPPQRQIGVQWGLTLRSFLSFLSARRVPDQLPKGQQDTINTKILSRKHPILHALMWTIVGPGTIFWKKEESTNWHMLSSGILNKGFIRRSY
ncbi:hypothetical protein Q7P37_001018 [Cladosporium fusiforme]